MGCGGMAEKVSKISQIMIDLSAQSGLEVSMEHIFLKLFNMSITASWAIAAVMALRLLLRTAPKWIRCALWAIVAVRLVCPFSLESRFSLVPSAETVLPAGMHTQIPYSTSPAIDTGISAVDSILNPILLESVSAPESGADPLHTLISAGSIVWAAGVIVLLGYGLFSYFRIHRKVEEAVLLRGNVYLCDAVRSPFILGLIRPRIYLPSSMEEISDRADAQTDYVLTHEQAHLRRGDHWWKLLGYLLLAVYWFNPLVWTAYILLCRDIELACDERAVRDLNLNARKAYSEALVACSMKRRLLMACPLAFGEVGVKERVKTVLYYKKPAFWLSVAAIAACAAVAVCFLTNPRKRDTLAERIQSERDELTERIGTMISEAEAVRYSITDWELTVDRIEGNRADCYFCANWISTRTPEEDPIIQGMYHAAESLPDEAQRAYAQETADGWLTEMQSWPKEEYLEQPIVILLEGQSLALCYPYVSDGVETLVPLQEYVDAEWRENSQERYQNGVDTILNAVSSTFSDAQNAESDAENSGTAGDTADGVKHFYIRGADADALVLDDVEWVTEPGRAAELGLTGDDMPGGFYVYNERESLVKCPFAEECSFTILDWYRNYEPAQVDRQTFLATIADRGETISGIPFIVEFADGKIVGVTEQYVP